MRLLGLRIVNGFCLLSLSAPCQTIAKVDPKMTSVLNGLGPSCEFIGEHVDYRSLSRVMKEHHVPGVSVAYIQNGTVKWATGEGRLKPGGPHER